MNISIFLSFSKLKFLILHHGLYTVIVHACAILLYSKLSPPLPPLTSFLRYFPMIEHSIVAFICVLLGAILCIYIDKIEEKNQREHSYYGAFALICTLPISRVLSRTVIYLCFASPQSSKAMPCATHGITSGKLSTYGVASDKVYSKSMLPQKWVSSYLAFPSLPAKAQAVYFCCTFSGVASD